MSYRSPIKTPQKSLIKSPQKNTFDLTGANLSGKKKERPKSTNPKKEELATKYSMDRDEVLKSTLKEIKEMKNDRILKVIEKSSKFSTTKDVISAIERHKKHFGTEEGQPEVHEIIKENPAAIFDQIGIELKKHIIKDLMEDILYSKKKFSEADETHLTNEADDEYEYVKEIIMNNLIDDEKREKLLEEGLFREIQTEYIHDKRTRILDAALKKLNIQNKHDFQPGAETIQDILKPSHIRREAGAKQLGFYNFQKSIERKKQMNLIKLALKTNKEKNRLQEIRKMNLETIKCLLSFKKNNKKRQKGTPEFECMKILRRIFIMNSHRDIQQNKYIMNDGEFHDCLKKLDLYPTYLKDEEVHSIFYDLTKHYESEVMDFYAFVEALKKISLLLIDDDVEDSVEEEASDTDTNDVLLLHFFEEFLEDSLEKFKHPNHKLIDDPEIKNYVSKHQNIHIFLFNCFTREKQKNDIFEAPQEPMLTFEKLFDMFTTLQLFPSKCEKLLIRFYFEYVSPDEHGLDFEDFCVFMPLIGLDIVDRFIKTSKTNVKRKKNSYEEDDEDEKKHIVNLEAPLKPIDKIMRFYTSKDFLGELPSIKQKIKEKEEDKMKRQLNAEERFYIKNPFTENILSYLNTKSLV